MRLLGDAKPFASKYRAAANSGSRLSVGAKLAYAMLLKYAWQDDACFPGQVTLAKHMGAAERSVRTYLKELETAALLEIEQRGLGKTNLYKLYLTIKAPPAVHGDQPHPDPGKPHRVRDQAPKRGKRDFRTKTYRHARIGSASIVLLQHRGDLAHRIAPDFRQMMPDQQCQNEELEERDIRVVKERRI